MGTVLFVFARNRARTAAVHHSRAIAAGTAKRYAAKLLCAQAWKVGVVEACHIHHEHMTSTSKRILCGMFVTLPLLILAAFGIPLWMMQGADLERTTVFLALLGVLGVNMVLTIVAWWYSEVHRHQQLFKLLAAQ